MALNEYQVLAPKNRVVGQPYEAGMQAIEGKLHLRCTANHTASVNFGDDIGSWEILGNDDIRVLSSAAHSFSTGMPIGIDDATGDWVKAQAGTQEAQAVVYQKLNDNVCLIAVNKCRVTATTAEWDAIAGTTDGLDVGKTYWLSDSVAGGITGTKPATYHQRAFVAISATEAKFVDGEPMRVVHVSQSVPGFA